MHDTSRLQRAYYSASIKIFLKQSPQTVLGHLAENHAHDLDPAQRMAWSLQIDLLQRELVSLGAGWIAFEFAIPRMGRRADVIIILAGIIFVVEFKIGAKNLDAAAIDQVVDYSLDLRNFHSGSHSRIIVPVVIAAKAVDRPVQLSLLRGDIAEPIFSNGVGLARFLRQATQQFSSQEGLVHADWMASSYKPTPTIIEAAQALYRSHRVDEITRSDADARNLKQTTECLARIIDEARNKRQKAICFVTGVPGAGKTLAGLNLVTQYISARQDGRAVFLSGNYPLVEVLREALAQDERSRSKNSKWEKIETFRRKVKSFIQNIHNFRDGNLTTEGAPPEHVAVFDEAQRAWNTEQLSSFMVLRKGKYNFNASEPDFLIEVFDRHSDWCVIVCLVGGGQEINAGEAGLTEWLYSLAKKYRHWKIYTSDQLDQPEYRWGKDLSAVLRGLEHKTEPDLHLAVSLRSFRAEKLSAFVNALVAGNTKSSRDLYGEIRSSYPIKLTRNLRQAKAWLRQQARGTERFGLVAYSGALRLKPEGIDIRERIDAPIWFLKGKTDVRSSFYLEDPATEFDIQGLELDWVGLCWEANFRRVEGGLGTICFSRNRVAEGQKRDATSLSDQRLQGAFNARAARRCDLCA